MYHYGRAFDLQHGQVWKKWHYVACRSMYNKARFAKIMSWAYKCRYSRLLYDARRRTPVSQLCPAKGGSLRTNDNKYPAREHILKTIVWVGTSIGLWYYECKESHFLHNIQAKTLALARRDTRITTHQLSHQIMITLWSLSASLMWSAGSLILWEPDHGYHQDIWSKKGTEKCRPRGRSSDSVFRFCNQIILPYSRVLSHGKESIHHLKPWPPRMTNSPIRLVYSKRWLQAKWEKTHTRKT